MEVNPGGAVGRSLVVPLLMVLVLGSQERRCHAARPAAVLAEFDVARRGDALTVPVTAGGRTYPFILSVSATAWIFDPAVRELLGPVRADAGADAVADKGGGQRYSTRAMHIGTLAVPAGMEAACMELRDELASLGQDVYGVVGVDFLRDKIFRVDFDAGKLLFLKAVGEDAGERFPLTWKQGLPYIPLELPGGDKEEFLIGLANSGDGAGNLRTETYLQLVARGNLVPIEEAEYEAYSPGAGIRVTHLARLDRLAVGPFNHRQLIFSDRDRSVLGLGYFSRYVVTFDMAHSAIYLKPGRDYGRRDAYNLAGLGLLRFGGDWIVSHVDARRAAERAGLKELDTIVEVDGVRAADLSLFELSRMFTVRGERKVRFVRKSSDPSERETTVILIEGGGQAQGAAHQ